MRNKFFTLILLLLANFIQSQEQHFKLLKTVKQNYVLSGKKHTDTFVVINTSGVTKLSNALIALAAYYACMASTDFADDGDSLINVLKLGKQGSTDHKNLIKKWFVNDRVANILLKQDCFQAAPGSSYFRIFDYLNFNVKADTVLINYKVTKYNHGKSSSYFSTDKALIKDNEIIMLVQNIWSKTN